MKKLSIFLCLLLLVSLVGCGSSPSSGVAKPEVNYTINKKDVPTTDPSTWAPGLKRQVTYWVQVPTGTTEIQVKKVGEYLLETDVKPLKNWNVAHFVFVYPNQQSGYIKQMFL